jgi:hypothetical protein
VVGTDTRETLQRFRRCGSDVDPGANWNPFKHLELVVDEGDRICWQKLRPVACDEFPGGRSRRLVDCDPTEHGETGIRRSRSRPRRVGLAAETRQHDRRIDGW